MGRHRAFARLPADHLIVCGFYDGLCPTLGDAHGNSGLQGRKQTVVLAIPLHSKNLIPQCLTCKYIHRHDRQFTQKHTQEKLPSLHACDAGDVGDQVSGHEREK